MENSVDMAALRKRYAALSRPEIAHRLRMGALETFVDDPDEARVSDNEAFRWFNDEVKYLNMRFSDLSVDIEAIDAAYERGEMTEDEYYRVDRRLEKLSEKAMADAQFFAKATRAWDREYGTDYEALVDEVLQPVTDVDVTTNGPDFEPAPEPDAQFDDEQADLEAELQAEVEAEALAELERQERELEERQRMLDEERQRDREAIENLPPRARSRAFDLGFGE